MNRRLIVLPEAEEELAAAMVWYEARRAGLGLEFLGVIDHYLASIAEDAERWPAWEGDDRYQRAVVERFPYVLVFEVRGDTVEIVAVSHGRRRPGYWKRRSS